MESCRKTWRQSNRRAETVVALDPTAELPSVWAAHVGSPGEPQPGTLPSAAQTPWRGAAGVALGASNTPHAPVPGPPLAVSPHVTGCLHPHPTPPASGGLPLSLLAGLGEVSAPGQGTWFPWQLPLAGLEAGAGQHRPECRKGSVPGGKLWWEGASRPVGHRLGRRGPCTPTPSPVTCPKAGGAWSHRIPAVLCADGTTLSLLFLTLRFACLLSSLLSWDSSPNRGQLWGFARVGCSREFRLR